MGKEIAISTEGGWLMSSFSHRSKGLRGPARFPARPAVALGILAFFCFPISRFYLSAQLDPEQCWEIGHSHAASSQLHDHSEHDHHSHAESLPADQDGEYFFQHCKDTYEGIALSPAQPLAVPVTASIEPPRTSWQSPERSRCPTPTNLPFLPFHPPRHLG